MRPVAVRTSDGRLPDAVSPHPGDVAEDAGAAPAVTPATPAARHGLAGMDGRRYGEVLLVTGGLSRLVATVYTTIGLSDCPQGLWEQLDAQAMARAHGAHRAILNGPRYFLMDEVASADMTDDIVTFGDLRMRRAATLPVHRGAGFGELYVERIVNRTTMYVYRKGRTVYALVAPEGSTYVMQSYALMVDPTLTEAGLAALGGRLRLPPGWSYHVRALGEDLVMQVEGQARLVQDDLGNSYQRRL